MTYCINKYTKQIGVNIDNCVNVNDQMRNNLTYIIDNYTKRN